MKKYFFVILSVCCVLTAQAQKIDRSKKPKAGAAPVITINDPAVYKLANGITVLVVENHKLPKISATYSIDAGPIKEGSKAGVIGLMGSMLNEGTQKMSKADFDEAVDKIGADVNLFASGGSASALTRYFEKAFLLMAEGLMQPAFNQESFDKLKTQTLTSMKANEKNVKAIAGRVNDALTYGIDHPKGEFETEASISALTLQDVKSAYSTYITPSRGYLTFVGDITPAQAKALAEKAFGNWKGNALSLPQLPVVQNPSTTEIDLVDASNAAQAEINVTNLIQIPLSSPDYFPVLLANQILGGGAESRLFMNLREKHGFTYGAYSSVGTGRFQTTFNATAAVRNEKADSAVMEFLNEIDRMRTSTVTDEELQTAKALYNGSFALGMENPARIAQFASNIIINDLPKDFYRTYLTRINAVTKEDIQRVANKYFNRNNTRVVVVGKGTQVLPSLSKLNIPVKQYDKYAAPVVESAPAPVANNATNSKPVTTDAKGVINDYLKAIGGVDEVNKAKTLWLKMEMEVQGMKLSVDQKNMVPNMEIKAVSMGGNTMQRSVFNGTTGFQEQMGNRKDMTAEEIKAKQSVKHFIEQVGYLDNNVKLELKGTEKVNGATAHKIVITNGDNVTTEYYDVNTHLLLRAETTENMGGQSVNQTFDFSNYKKAGNILYPFDQTLTLSAGGGEQVLVFKILEAKINEGVTAADFK
jgi:zinc protease